MMGRAKRPKANRSGILFLGLFLFVSDLSAQKILGLWESASGPAPRDGLAYHFREDGTFERLSLMLFDIGFVIESGEVVLVNRAGPDQPLELEMGDGYMDMIVPDGRAIRKTKIRSPEGRESLLFGDWSFPYENQGLAFERYTENGRMMFRLPLAAERGTYEVKGRKIHLTFDGVAPRDSNERLGYKRSDRQLLLGSGAKQRRYTLVDGGRWYDAPPAAED